MSMADEKRPLSANNHLKSEGIARRRGVNEMELVNLVNGLDEDEYISSRTSHCSTLYGDRANIALLFFLYLLQGIPLGLSAAVPMILQNRKVSYKQQAEFSFVHWPFSLKLLWAPIVDSIYSAHFGRRKTWLVPTQYLIGVFMLFLSINVDRWLGNEDINESPHIGTLAILFFCLNFLAATQDIAVDGWALTMLKRVNVGHASTCNSVGQTAGYFLGYVVFIALESADFCNTYIRDEPKPEGIVTLAKFLYYWGLTFIVVTSLVAIFKKEAPEKHKQKDYEMDVKMNIIESYSQLWQIVKLPSIRVLAVILLTAKIGFSACDAVTSLKLVDAGVPKEKFAMMAIPLVPLQIILPLALSKYTAGSRPMDVYIKALPYRLAFNFVAAGFVWVTPYIIQDSAIPTYYYVILVLTYCLHQITLYSMFVSVMAFFARVSDPAVGGTYMTLLNTLANLGGQWPSTLALWLIDFLTWKSCSNNDDNTCSSPQLIKECNAGDGQCITWLDGYYMETLICTIIGCLWMNWGRRKILDLQNRNESVWKIRQRAR